MIEVQFLKPGDRFYSRAHTIAVVDSVKRVEKYDREMIKVEFSINGYTGYHKHYLPTQTVELD